jgi:hypothetical protein
MSWNLSRYVMAIVESTTGKDRQSPRGRATDGRHPQWRPRRHERPSDPARPGRRLPDTLRPGGTDHPRAFGVCPRFRRAKSRFRCLSDTRPPSPTQPECRDVAADNPALRCPPAAASRLRTGPGTGGTPRGLGPGSRRQPGRAHPPVPHQHATGPDPCLGRPAAQACGAIHRPAARRLVTRSHRLGALRRCAPALNPAVCGA